jgi:hypothetical protein
MSVYTVPATRCNAKLHLLKAWRSAIDSIHSGYHRRRVLSEYHFRCMHRLHRDYRCTLLMSNVGA